MSVRVEQDGRFRRLTLTDHNTLDTELSRALLQEIRAAEADPSTGAILLDAAGPMFCGGLDSAAPPDDELFRIGAQLSKPLIVAVKGVALTAGVALAANAHVAVAAQGSSFGLTDIREGRWNESVFQAAEGAMGRRRTLELTLTSRIFTTPEALSYGLIHSVAPAFEIDDRAEAIAHALANASPEVVRAALARPSIRT